MQRVKLHWVLLVAFLGVLVLGVAGFLLTPGFAADGSSGNRVASAIYQTLQLFVLEAPVGPVPWWTHLARFGAVLVTYVAVVSGVLWLARDRLWRIRAHIRRDHAIVCGLGDKGYRLLRALRAAGIAVVAIERDEGNEHAESARDLGAIVLSGDARDPVALARAGIRRAKFLVACCGADDTNAEVIIQARDAVGDSGARVLRCVAHITDPQLAQLLQEQQLRAPGSDRCRFEFFNIHTSGAGVLLDEFPPFAPVSAGDGGPAAEPPRVVVVGLGPLGESVVTGVAWRWARASLGRAGPAHITVFAPDAEARVGALCRCVPQLATSAELTAHDIDGAHPAFDAAPLSPAGASQPSIAYVCMDNDASSLVAGLSLFRFTRDLRLPVVVCLLGDEGVASLLGSGTSREFEALSGFPVLERTCGADIVFGRIARKIHERYLDNAERDGRPRGSEPSLLPWDELPEHLRESNRRQADDMARKLEAAGYGIVPLDSWEAVSDSFTPEEIEALSVLEHERWVADRKRLGWKTGPEKDVRRKRTPHLVPWEELSEEIRELDRNAVREIPELLLSAQLAIYRRPDR